MNCVAALLLLPTVTSVAIDGFQPNQWYAIAYACINTVGAYGAFAQALKYWQASKVGMVIAMVPVFTLLYINLMSSLFPELVKVEQIHTSGMIGVILIVMGSMIASIGKK